MRDPGGRAEVSLSFAARAAGQIHGSRTAPPPSRETALECIAEQSFCNAVCIGAETSLLGIALEE